MQCRFAKGTKKSDIPAALPLYLNNFGYYKAPEYDLAVRRPEGRRDYHLLLVLSGEISVGKDVLHSGEAYIFYPGEPQEYTYRAGADRVYDWVHFSGTRVSALLSGLPHAHGKIGFADRAESAEKILRTMFSVYSEDFPESESICTSLFEALLRLVCANSRAQIPFAAAVRQLGNFSAPVRIADLAAEYQMSEAHFIRAFKSYAGLSPHRYRRKMQCERAAALLAETDLPVKDVAAAVGFDDPLYFSRVFRAETGASPRGYRGGSENPA